MLISSSAYSPIEFVVGVIESWSWMRGKWNWISSRGRCSKYGEFVELSIQQTFVVCDGLAKKYLLQTHWKRCWLLNFNSFFPITRLVEQVKEMK